MKDKILRKYLFGNYSWFNEKIGATLEFILDGKIIIMRGDEGVFGYLIKRIEALEAKKK